MYRWLATFALLAASTLGARPAYARVVSMGAETWPDSAPSSIVLSAFFLRGTHLDRSAFPTDDASRRRQLQRHFDVVLAALVANFDRSLDIALVRLERARGEHWSVRMRSAWRQTLAERRLVNMQRLRLYQLRGVFPQNEHVADRAVPVFVDNYNTACAVGHLMRQSGWSDEVAAIQHANNLVYVPDVHTGPLVDWVLISGLTQEEAALIQPSYFPPIFDKTMDVLASGGSITRNGLHFDNFRFIAGELTHPDLFPQVPPPVNQVDLTHFGAAVRQGVFGGGFSHIIDPIHDDWLFAGAISDNYTIYAPARPWGILFSYDVEPTDPDERLVAATLESFGANYNYLLDGVLEIETEVYGIGPAEPPLLAHLALADTNPGSSFFEGNDGATFAPQQTLSVVTAVKVSGEAAFTSLVHSFERAPESVSNSDADFDADGDVDGADFLAWQKGVGVENATLAQGDANNDGQSDGADLAVWKSHAVSTTQTASVPAPEPAALTVALVTSALLLIRRRASGRESLHPLIIWA
jgi:hypothetical protein